MSDLPVPKYKIGQAVYKATTDRVSKKHPCPDCFGEKVWTVTSPAGLKTTALCPRCARDGYFRSDAQIPSLEYICAEPMVRRLTVGSITAKTHPWNDDDPIEYMCNETGIGNGSTYRERLLYETEQEALEVAKILAEKEQTQFDSLPQALKSYKMSSLTVDLAAYQLSWRSVYDAWYTARDYKEIVDRIEENDKKADSYDIEELIAVSEDKPWRDKNPIMDIIESVRAGDITTAQKALECLK